MTITEHVIDLALEGIIWIATGVLYVLYKVFSLINYAVPEEFNTSISFFLDYARYIDGLVDVETLFTVMGIYINFLIAFYTFKLVRWAYAHLPWIGKHKSLPTVEKVGKP